MKIYVDIYINYGSKDDPRTENPTPVVLKTLLGSFIAIQPIRQPGTSHPLEMEPSVTTGTIDANIPIGTNGFFPYIVSLKTSSEITIIPSFLAISATYTQHSSILLGVPLQF